MEIIASAFKEQTMARITIGRQRLVTNNWFKLLALTLGT